MVDLTTLTDLPSPTTDDIIYVVDDVAGAKNPRKCSIANLHTLYNGVSATLTNKSIDADTNTITNIKNADIKPGAGIDATKIGAGGVTSTEFGYIGTLSSDAQTQIDTKAPIASPTFTGTVTSPKTIMTGRHQWDKGADIVSASGITLGTDGNYFVITGTTTINTITATDWQAGAVVILQFSGILTVTHNSGGTNDILLGNATNFVTAAGNRLMLIFDGTDWAECARSTGTGGSDNPWTANHDFDVYYYDMQVQSAPASPATDNGRFYLKVIDSNNDGLFCKIKKAGAFVEVQVF